MRHLNEYQHHLRVLLEPYDAKVSRTVLRGESPSNGADLLDINNQTDFQGILLEDVPIEAQVGVIGHEIAHAVEYESRSTMGILQLATMYLTKEGKKTFERATDLRTIGRGLGWQLREWAQYSMFDSPKATEEYKTFKRAIYMSPKEIEDVIQNYQIYDERPTSTVVMSAQ